MLTGILSVGILTACSEKQPDMTETVSEDSVDAAESSSEPVLEAETTESTETDLQPVETTPDVSVEVPEAEDAAPVDHPTELNFVIIQDVRDHMFKLMDAEGRTLTVDTESEQGYVGDLVPKSGEYEVGKSGRYVLPYSERFTLLDMDDKIVYVSMEYPCVTSVGIQNAAMVTMDANRTVTITGYGKDEFSYRVWLPSKGVTKEVSTELVTGKASGTIKIYYNGIKVVVEQLSGEGAPIEEETTPSSSELSESEQSADEDSDDATVNWQIACPWADKIARGTWDDGADISNVKQLREGIMNARFIPVEEIEEENAKVVKLTFYDESGKKLGMMNFWQKGRHVQFDDQSFDYDDLGLE